MYVRVYLREYGWIWNFHFFLLTVAFHKNTSCRIIHQQPINIFPDFTKWRRLGTCGCLTVKQLLDQPTLIPFGNGCYSLLLEPWPFTHIYFVTELHDGNFPLMFVYQRVKPPFSHGFRMVFPWFSHGFPMVFPFKEPLSDFTKPQPDQATDQAGRGATPRHGLAMAAIKPQLPQRGALPKGGVI